MYQDLMVQILTKQEKGDISQTAGIRQVGNLSPVVFLFLVSAFAKSLETEWKSTALATVKFSRAAQNNIAHEKGQLLGHTLNSIGIKEGIISKLFQLLYVYDGAFLFESQDDMIRGIVST